MEGVEVDRRGDLGVRPGRPGDDRDRYYISSLPVGVKCFARAVRSHWGIENGCHWSLDMTFREDESRIRDTTMRENFAWLNRFGLSLLKQHPSRDSIIGKRRACGWSEQFLLEVLAGKTVSERWPWVHYSARLEGNRFIPPLCSSVCAHLLVFRTWLLR